MKKDVSESACVVHKISSNEVKVGDVMAFVYYAKVKRVHGGNLDVQSLDTKMNFEVKGELLIEAGFSADQYQEEIKVSKTKAAEILVSSHNRPLTVCFEKINGDERVLRGRLVTPEPLLGRSMVEDLDINETDRIRLVDHRTIRYLIVEGVKYIVK